MNAPQIKKIADWLQTGSINVFGLPFSGKDTHGTKLAEIFNAAFISGGHILRSAEGPQHIKDHIGEGHLAPSDEYLAIVMPYLSQNKFAGKPLILSSVGRWHGEESSVIQAAKDSGHPVKAVVYLSITESEAKRRWQLAERGRQDDVTEQVLLTRFSEFHQKTLPVIEYYRQHGLLIETDGMPAKDEVSASILSGLAKLAGI